MITMHYIQNKNNSPKPKPTSKLMKISTHSLLLIPFLLLFFSSVSEGKFDNVVVNIKDGLDQKMSLTLRCQSK